VLLKRKEMSRRLKELRDRRRELRRRLIEARDIGKFFEAEIIRFDKAIVQLQEDIEADYTKMVKGLNEWIKRMEIR